MSSKEIKYQLVLFSGIESWVFLITSGHCVPVTVWLNEQLCWFAAERQGSLRWTCYCQKHKCEMMHRSGCRVSMRVKGQRLLFREPGLFVFFLARLQVKLCEIRATAAHSASRQSARDAFQLSGVFMWHSRPLLRDTPGRWRHKSTRVNSLGENCVKIVCWFFFVYELQCISGNLVLCHEREGNPTRKHPDLTISLLLLLSFWP